ncbi:hypothetical protein J2N86_15045 (plasmid) [Legionella lytica]|uniref:Uncharacterized protein n=1 Tax=Legionella lytica TaxID=96232 RepID=A0ABY4YCW0_9GAMM|nr:hypothetical protein [Legionella lytica]USQ15276.1 hypothetical protein J2N86_15045 [Legionella lytica]
MHNNSDDTQADLEQHLSQIKEIKSEFIKTTRFSQSLIIVLNSGGIVALVDFFTNINSPPPIFIKFASIFFVLGTIFGIFTLFGDFISGYFLYSNLLKIRTKELLIKYYCDKEQEKILNNMRSGLSTLIILGIMSPILWLLGVACIFAYILNMQCAIAMLFLFILLIVGLGCFLFYRLKSKFEWDCLS